MQDTAPVLQLRDDATPIDEVGRAMCTALDQGNAVVSIVIDTRRRSLEKQLTVHGVNIVEALRTGTYAPLDALEVLSTIIIDGSPDVIRFAEVIGATIDRAAEQHGRVLIIGELVPLMRAEGEHAGAIELENLWRSFIAARPIFLDCR
jgi:hypothetical protein